MRVSRQLGREGMASMDEMIGAYAGILSGELDRKARQAWRAAEDELQLSPAEMQLAIDLGREGIDGWRQQVPIGKYFADFYFPEQRLVVEVDGAQHQQMREYDANRDKEMMEKHNVAYVFRVRAVDVFNDGMMVVNAIRYLLGGLS